MAKPKIAKTKTPTILLPQKTIWQHKYFFEGLVFLFAFALFANSIPNGYNMDDELVTINHRLTAKGISAIPEIFTSPYYEDAAGYSYEYRPIVLVSFAIEHEFFGDNVHVSHFFNVLLYALCCLLLFVVLKKLFRDYSPLISVAITLLFLAHPAHTEVVCSIKNRDEILSLIFSSLTLFVALKVVQENKKWCLLLIPVFYMLALMSKLSVISFAIIIPLALILFTEVSMLITLLIAFLLATCFFFFPSNMRGYDKWIYSTSIVLSALFFCVLFQWKKIIEILKSPTAFLFHVSNYQTEVISKNKADSFASFKFSELIPDKSFFTFKIMLPFNFLIAMAISCIYFQIGIGFVFISLLFTIGSFRKEEALQWWANLGLQIILVFSFYWYGFWKYSCYTEFFIVVATFKVLFDKKNLLIVHLLSVFLILLQSVFFLQFSTTLTSSLYLLVLVSFYFQYRIPLILLVLAETNAFYMDYQGGFITPISTILNLVLILSVVVVFLLVSFKKDLSFLNKFYQLFVVLVVCFYSTQESAHLPNANLIVSTLEKHNPQLINYKQNRPVEYVENVISANTPFPIKAGTSLVILLDYIQKSIFPYPLCFYYGYSVISEHKISEPICVLSFVLHLLLLIAAIGLLKKTPLLCFGLLIYFFSIASFSNFFQPMPGMVADRFLFIPSLGWCIIFVFFIVKLALKLELKSNIEWKDISLIGKYSFLTLLMVYSVFSFSRNRNWKDALTLFRHDIYYVDNSSQAHNLLALRLMKDSYDSTPSQALSMRHEALSHFKRAKEIYPAFFNATYDIARVYSVLNIQDSAIVAYKQTLQLNPTFTDASTAVGEILIQQNKPLEALPYFQNLITQYPENYLGYDKVSFVYFSLKNYEKAIATNLQAVHKMPTNPQPYIVLGKIYHALQREDSAKLWLQKALVVNPENLEAQQLILTLK